MPRRRRRKPPPDARSSAVNPVSRSPRRVVRVDEPTQCGRYLQLRQDRKGRKGLAGNHIQNLWCGSCIRTAITSPLVSGLRRSSNKPKRAIGHLERRHSPDRTSSSVLKTSVRSSRPGTMATTSRPSAEASVSTTALSASTSSLPASTPAPTPRPMSAIAPSWSSIQWAKPTARLRRSWDAVIQRCGW